MVKKNKKPRLKHRVCKPCWELKYCPYGPLVELFPLTHPDDDIQLDNIKKSRDHYLRLLTSGTLKTADEIIEAAEKVHYFHPYRWALLSKHDTSDLSCNVFGHICPVFFSDEGFTETREYRTYSRHIPRSVMLKVIRRDGQMCRRCHSNVPDDQVEFDHIIPFSKGGPSTVENVQLLCMKCNRIKLDSLAEILEPKK